MVSYGHAGAGSSRHPQGGTSNTRNNANSARHPQAQVAQLMRRVSNASSHVSGPHRSHRSNNRVNSGECSSGQQDSVKVVAKAMAGQIATNASPAQQRQFAESFVRRNFLVIRRLMICAPVMSVVASWVAAEVMHYLATREVRPQTRFVVDNVNDILRWMIAYYKHITKKRSHMN